MYKHCLFLLAASLVALAAGAVAAHPAKGNMIVRYRGTRSAE